MITITSNRKLHTNRANWKLTMNLGGSRLLKTFTKSKTIIRATKTTNPIEIASNLPSLRATPAAISAKTRNRTNILKENQKSQNTKLAKCQKSTRDTASML